MVNLSIVRETDLLIGITSIADSEQGLHYFMADFDDIKESSLGKRIGRILFDKHRLGTIYFIKTGKGFHLLTFSKPITLDKYIEILCDMNADPKYIHWVEKVGYGVLRMSRRSSHMTVPVMTKIFVSPFNYQEDSFKKLCYKNILDFEDNNCIVKRVKVYTKKDRWFE